MRAMLVNARPLIYFLVVAVFSLSLPRRPSAATLVATESAVTPPTDAETDRVRVHAILDREDVQAHLQAYGISADEARARVESLTDDEVALIVGQLDQLPAGADGVALVIALAAILAGIVLGTIVWAAWSTFKALSNAFQKKAD